MPHVFNNLQIHILSIFFFFFYRIRYFYQNKKMSINYGKENEIQIESEFNKLTISDKKIMSKKYTKLENYCVKNVLLV